MTASHELDLLRSPELVARDLLGWTVVCRGTAAVLVEVEAYHESEPAAHSYGGRPTKRTKHLFGAAGTCYVYFTYGMHWCMNLVTGLEGEGAAVLMRAAIPLEGVGIMRERRGREAERELCAGPARLVQALGVRAEDGGKMMFMPSVATVRDALSADTGDEHGPMLVRDCAAARSVGIVVPVPEDQLATGPRIGISRATDLPWRYAVAGSRWLSKPMR